MKSFLPPIRIHTWGGLGSQLFSVAVCADLLKQFPSRSIQIVLHTGGVTRRIPEVVDLFPNFHYSYQEDFRSRMNSPQSDSKSKKFSLKVVIKNILSKTGFISHCNDDISTQKLRPWVLSLRGHYSYRTITADFLFNLKDSILKKENTLELNNHSICCIHYRLGDLLTLSDKKPISSFFVLSEFETVKERYDFSQLFVFSDSPAEAKRRFSEANTQSLEVPTLSTTEVIATSINADYFIGTSSKISFWIAGIRASVNHNESSLPKNNGDQYKGLVGNQMKLINTYDSGFE